MDTYAHNHPETPRDHIVLGDIKDVVENLDEFLAGRSVDIVVGGPPCQGFSMANRQRLIDDIYIKVMWKLWKKSILSFLLWKTLKECCRLQNR